MTAVVDRSADSRTGLIKLRFHKLTNIREILCRSLDLRNGMRRHATIELTV